MSNLLLAILCVSLYAGYVQAKQTHCRQTTYDAIYRAAIHRALNRPELTDKDIQERNQAIRILRRLCFEQRSTFELNNPLTPDFVKKHKTQSRELDYEPNKS